MVVFQDSSTGTTVGIGDKAIIEGFLGLLGKRLNGSKRFPLTMRILRNFGEIGNDKIEEALSEAIVIERELDSIVLDRKENIQIFKAADSGEFIWTALRRIIELTATYRSGSFFVRELGFWPLLNDLNKKGKKRGAK